MKKKLLVTSPLLPKLSDFNVMLEDIWESKWLTNHGKYHNKLESKLNTTLKVQNTSLFNNGTMALFVALKALNLPKYSDVITTPFTFAATPHSIVWANLNPIFCDIEKETMTIDVNKIEKLITPNTSAILAVHVYGFPCDVYKIEQIAKKHNLKVIYDGAHVFGTEIDGKGIGSFGDITMFSFHATKLFNSIEGGALTYNDVSLKEKIYNLRNFGIKNEEEVVDVGLNGKMNEIQSAIGLLNLPLVDEEKNKRLVIKNFYDENLKQINGIRIPKMPVHATYSMQYYVICIEKEIAGFSRDDLYDALKKEEIYSRKYFYPPCTEYTPYLDLGNEDTLPITYAISTQVLCLPYHSGVMKDNLQTILTICKKLQK